MASDLAANGIDLGLRRKYDAAIGNWVTYKPAAANLNWSAHQHEDLSVLLHLGMNEHLALIDEIWEDILDLKDGNKEVRNMVDPAPRTFPLLTASSRSLQAQRICYRCDQREPKDVADNGFLPSTPSGPLKILKTPSPTGLQTASA